MEIDSPGTSSFYAKQWNSIPDLAAQQEVRPPDPGLGPDQNLAAPRGARGQDPDQGQSLEVGQDQGRGRNLGQDHVLEVGHPGAEVDPGQDPAANPDQEADRDPDQGQEVGQDLQPVTKVVSALFDFYLGNKWDHRLILLSNL